MLMFPVDWSGVSLPGQLVSSEDENLVTAARDVLAAPLTPDDFRWELQLVGQVVLVLSCRSAESLVETQSDSVRDPIESAGLFEGDIANVKIADLRRLRSGDYTKNAIRELWKKWPDATIPYVISSKFGSYERSVIAKAMKTYHSKTCIKFIPRTSEAAYIHLIKGSGCSSTIGRSGSMQTVSLGRGCVYSGELLWDGKTTSDRSPRSNMEENNSDVHHPYDGTVE